MSKNILAHLKSPDVYCILLRKKRKRKDTGYSTASSQNLYSTKASSKDKKGKKSKRICSSSPSDCDPMNIKKQKRAKNAEKADKK